MSPILFTDTNPYASIKLLEDGRLGDENGIPFMNAEDRRDVDPIHTDGKLVICDLDGTMAKPFPGRSMYTGAEVHKDTVCESLALMIEKLYDQGYQIYMISARSATELAKEDGFDKERVELLMTEYGEATGITNTFHWLRENFIPFDKLILRPAGESKQDIFMKQEIFKTFIKDPDNVYCAFDDNGPIVDLWRSYGIQTYQCAPSWDKRPLKEEALDMLAINKANPNRWC
jgi:hypothetical protein